MLIFEHFKKRNVYINGEQCDKKLLKPVPN